MNKFSNVHGGELIQGVAMAVAEQLGGGGFAEVDQTRMALTCANRVMERFGGSHTYVPFGQGATGKDGELHGDMIEFVAEQLRGLLREIGVGDDEAFDTAKRCAEAVRRVIRGGHVYIPKGAAGQNQDRDLNIWLEFNGANYFDLSRKYRLSVMRIRQIVAAMRARRRRT